MKDTMAAIGLGTMIGILLAMFLIKNYATFNVHSLDYAIKMCNSRENLDYIMLSGDFKCKNGLKGEYIHQSER